jgi:predicted ester cyclase
MGRNGTLNFPRWTRKQPVPASSGTKKTEKPTKTPLPPLRPAVVAVKQWVSRMNEHNIDTMMTVAHDDCVVHFGETQMHIRDFCEEIKRIFASFPDFAFEWSEPKETQPNVVEIAFFQASGTHTGEPYGFGPYPTLAAKGIKVKNHPEFLLFNISNGKIETVTNLTSSELTGPPGIYRQIGGFPV